MQSLTPQTPDSTVLTRLSLAKFSHTTTSLTHRGPLNWSHIMGNGDLTAIFEKRTMTSFTPDRVLLKVLRVHDSLVRRFQIKFTFDPDYYTALSILGEIGCPVSEPSVGYMRKLTSSQWSLGSIEGKSMVREPPYVLSSMSGPSEPVGASTLQRPSTTSASGNSLPSTSWSAAQTSDTTCARGSKNENALSIAQTHLQHAPAVDRKDVRNSDKLTTRPFTSSAAERLLEPEIDIPPRRILPWSSTSKRANITPKAPPAFPHAAVTDATSSNIGTGVRFQMRLQTQTRPATSCERITMPRLRLLPPALPKVNNDRQMPHPESGSHIPSRTGSYNQPKCLQTAFVSSCPSTSSNLQADRAEANKFPAGHQGEAHQEKNSADRIAADLSSYISAPTEERMASLETWICKQIEDDGFLELCRDVEGIEIDGLSIQGHEKKKIIALVTEKQSLIW
ncbi:uncharacterized protein BO96DRAFT_337468 [Aspergillus niger CBS 101883]|uniref:Contig An11c0090, genomic contig n=3 Tax=Aspergillus niger TaxID=5061 RepID=A2QVU5_ASPNC|nr:uncharacterized protein BO96DRAFT_337468 [Aspergillus niger CBS 101883]XP_059601553.1 uncharacterized protein An11g02680 [Aspergillus niger]PYH56710.1 hypothetical protein BO96DRAFT_337468 [Aspergillus niger CBS 101883]RDH14789.1 hypothetical protein M747DRAFT_319164 [Aspergillus niger ATCC 13496]CAK40610.1 unnamed protein product [Aspergillus niger]